MEFCHGVGFCFDQKTEVLAQIYQGRRNKGLFQGLKCGGLQLMEGQYGGGALPCLCNEGTRLCDVLDVNVWDQSTQWQGDNS